MSCKNKEHGCRKRTRASRLAAHEAGCRLLFCPATLCVRRFVAADLLAHVGEDHADAVWTEEGGKGKAEWFVGHDGSVKDRPLVATEFDGRQFALLLQVTC